MRVASALRRAPLAILGPDPGDDFPDVVVRLEDLAEMRHRPDHVLRALAHEALLRKRIARAQASGAEGNHAEQRVVVVSVNPNFVGERRRHSAAATTAMTAVAVM